MSIGNFIPRNGKCRQDVKAWWIFLCDAGKRVFENHSRGEIEQSLLLLLRGVVGIFWQKGEYLSYVGKRQVLYSVMVSEDIGMDSCT